MERTPEVIAKLVADLQADDEFVLQVVRLDTTACEADLPLLRSQVDELASNVRALIAKARACVGVPVPAETAAPAGNLRCEKAWGCTCAEQEAGGGLAGRASRCW